ncbi:glycoside hydrolase family 18 protein [Candidatus Dependentiae bacterium]|nr:glycoside hydrolase family 18 protein [Candidatus Dependentiae bacterium]
MKFSIISISFFIILLVTMHTFFVTAQCPTPVPIAYEHVRPGKVVAAYFGGWDKYHATYNVENIEKVADVLTHIIYAFAKPNSKTGLCELADEWADLGANLEHRKKIGGNFGKLLKLKKKYPHLKILLSVGGGTYSKALSEIAKQGKISQFAKSVVQILERYEYVYDHSKLNNEYNHWFEYPELFDGVDLDWEWTGAVPSEDIDGYTQLLKQLSALLKRKFKKMILTTAIQVNSKVISALDLSQVSSYVDWFNIMSYNYGGPNVSGISMNAPICNQWSDYSIDSSINSLMAMGISPAKMVLGIPLYGHVYDKTDSKLGSAFIKTEKTGAFRYNQIKDLYLDNPGCNILWHPKSHVPYAYCPEDQIFVSYDDENSIKIKYMYSKQKRLKGVFFWRLSGDDDDHSLIRSIKE